MRLYDHKRCINVSNPKMGLDIRLTARTRNPIQFKFCFEIICHAHAYKVFLSAFVCVCMCLSVSTVT